MFIIYKCDTWHSDDSKQIIAIATTLKNAVNLCQEKAENEGETLSEHDRELLKSIKQTQGYEGEGEFLIEEADTNILF